MPVNQLAYAFDGSNPSPTTTSIISTPDWSKVLMTVPFPSVEEQRPTIATS
jgi:hypothetical protein